MQPTEVHNSRQARAPVKIEVRRFGGPPIKSALLVTFGMLLISTPGTAGDGPPSMTYPSGEISRNEHAPTSGLSRLAANTQTQKNVPKKNGKKPFKKKPKAVKVDDFGPMDVQPVGRGVSDLGIGVHREQEGVDRPYSTEVSGSSVISKLKAEDSAEGNSDSLAVETVIEATMIAGAFQFGAELLYTSIEEKKSPPANSETPVTPSFNEVKLGGGPVIKVNYGSLDTSLNVPFAYTGISYIVDEFKFSNGVNVNYSGTAARIGGGLHMFLDSNISWAPKIEYFNESLSSDSGVKISRKGPRFLMQLAIFL